MKNVFKAVLFMLFMVLTASFVNAGSANPALTDPGSKSVNEGTLLQVSLVASALSAADDGPYTNFTGCMASPNTASGTCTGLKNSFSIGSTTANIINLSNTAGLLNWTPDFTQSGTYFFNLSASDNDSISTRVLQVTVNDVPPKLTVTGTLELGGVNQERSNPKHDTASRREVNVSGTVTIKNEARESVTGLKGTVTFASGFTDSDLKVNFTFPKTTLADGESITVPISVRVPGGINAITTSFVESAVNVASVAFSAATSTSTISSTTQINLRAENNLKIKDVKVRFDGKTENVDNGETVKKMKPGQAVEFVIVLENKFSDNEDVTIEDVELTVVGGGDLDIDEDEDVGDLNPEDKETITFSTVIDEDADDGTFDVKIEVVGVDEHDARHGERWDVNFEVKRESHEISIQSKALSPQVVACENDARLTIKVKNTGKRNEEDVYVNIASPELRYGDRSEKLSLDKDDEDSLAFTIPVPASTARPATYRVSIDTYYNTGTKSVSDVVLLKTDHCGPVEEKPPAEEPEKKPPVVVVQPPQEQPKVNVTQAPAKKGFMETPQYVALLVLAYVAVIGGGIGLLVKLLRKP